MKKFVGLGLICLIIGLGWWARDILSFSALSLHYLALKSAIAASQGLALIVFGGLYCLTVSLSLPVASVLTLGGAALFGWIGVVPIWIGATSGAAIVFVMVRFFFGQWAEQRLAHALQRFRGAFLARPFRWALSLRLIPVVPFWVANALPALLGMRFDQFVVSTAVGILPGTLIYVGVGVGFDHVLSQGVMPNLDVLAHPQVWAPLLALGCLSVVSAIVSQRQEGVLNDNPR